MGIGSGSLGDRKAQYPGPSVTALLEPFRDRQESIPEEVAPNDAFEILKNQRRRRTFQLLEAHGGRTTLSDLAEEIAAMENGIDRRAISSAQRKCVYVGLYQRHLPKMDDAGVVEFDKRSGDVTLTVIGRKLWQWRNEKRTTEGTGRETYWPTLYFSIGTLNLGVLAIDRLQMAYIGAMAAILSVFLAVVTVHFCLDRGCIGLLERVMAPLSFEDRTV